jgi:putative ABC transport system permease protein
MGRIRFALRSLAKAPLLSLVVVLSLALGIGANTAIFSLLHQVVLSSLPVEKPEELALLTSPGDFKSGRSSSNDAGGMDYIFSYRVFRALEKVRSGVSGMAAFRDLGANLAFGKQTNPGGVTVVSGQYFPMLGVKPLLGRVITPEDDGENGGNAVAMVSYGFWMDKLGGDRTVLNQPIRINGHAFTVVGITPKDFTGTTLGNEPDAFVPLVFNPQLTPNHDGTKNWNDYWLYVIARVPTGATRAQAEASLNGTYAGLLEEQVKTEKFRSAKNRERFLQSRLSLKDGRQGNSSFRQDSRTPVLILMTATGLVLLIAMANAANLLLARSAQRRRELAIRAAMGASRGELIGLMLTEALLLAAGGAVAGLLLARLTLSVLISRVIADSDPVHFLNAELNWTMLGFGLAISAVTGILFGLYPAWEAARSSMGLTLKNESGQASPTRGAARVRKVLVCAQVAISLVLLIPTGLFLKSLVNLLHVDLGMKTENVVGFSVSPSLNGYTNQQTHALLERLETDLAAIPGATGVAGAMVPLIAGNNWGNNVVIEGRPGRDQDHSMFNEIGPGFFGKMGIPLISGREFTESDNLASPRVAIVNEQFVKKILEGRNPLGIKFGSGKPEMEIVGVVKNSHYSGVKQEPPALYFIPWRQDKELNSLAFYLRTALPPAQMIPQIRRVVAAVDRDLPAENLRTLDEQILKNIKSDRLVMELAAAFAALATVLAMLGLYGVMAHSVTRRTREIGIRMALGAAPVRIRGMVMREMLWILAIGIAIGVPAALALAKVTESQLFGVKSQDVVVAALAVSALSAAAALAGFIPALRASRVNPLRALRYE